MPAATSPVVRGPLEGPPPPTGAPQFDLAGVGYREEEFFLSGTATAYAVGERGAEGRWEVDPTDTAPYTTRVVVRRPVDADRFNGTALVEWNNVSGGIDAGPDWTYTHRHIVREGMAWIGVSAQKVGIDGGGFVAGAHLKQVAPERYAALDHPGDRFSYDMFSQAGRAARDGSVLGGTPPARVIAMGESQSAMFLVSYVNGVDRREQVFDAFLLHGRGVSGAPFDDVPAIARPSADGELDLDAALAAQRARTGEQVRADARVPVIILQSETDVFALGGLGARQDDSANVRLWEIAGAAHADSYLLNAASADDGSLPVETLAQRLANTDMGAVAGEASLPINAGPQQHYIAQTAVAALERWVRDGAVPPNADRLEVGGDGSLARDERGIGKGGIRTPWVDVPTAVLTGLGQSGSVFALLFGVTEAFDDATLAKLYPGGRAEYLERFDASTDAAVSAGFLLPADIEEIKALARAACPLP